MSDFFSDIMKNGALDSLTADQLDELIIRAQAIRSEYENTKEEEIRLYRIMDITLRRSLWERMFGLGTIHCCSADKSTPEFDICWIRDAMHVKEMLSGMIEKERMEKRVTSREFMTDEDDSFDE